MSFFKSLLLAILATIFLTYVFGLTLFELTHLNVMVDGAAIEPVKALGVSALVIMIIFIIMLAAVLSVFGGFIFIGLILFGSIVMLTLGMFWPIALLALAIWAFGRNKNPEQLA